MGSFGSGRRWCYSKKGKLDEGLKLDINRMKRQGQIRHSCYCSGDIQWTYTNTGEYASSLGYESNLMDEGNMWLRLKYSHTPWWSEEAEKVDYTIKIASTHPNYGGRRLWFICPITGRRAAVLHKPNTSSYFASRHAFNMLYESQSQCPISRAAERKWKLINKLGGENFYYLKPKGMHRKTHERMLKEIEALEYRLDYSMLMRFGSFMRV